MSLLWAVPPIAVAVAVTIILAQLKDMAEASQDLSLQLRRLDEVRIAVASVREESARARASLHELRAR